MDGESGVINVKKPQSHRKDQRNRGNAKKTHQKQHEQKQYEQKQHEQKDSEPKKERKDHPIIDALKVEESSAEPCGVCFDHTKYHAAYTCGHTAICYKCSLRLRALMKDRKCPLCRTESKDVIISSEKGRTYKDLVEKHNLVKDEKHGILFESESAKQDVLKILQNWCPYPECYEKGVSAIDGGFQGFQGHLHDAHNTMLCDLCFRHKHEFSVEFETYTRSQLLRHNLDGGFQGKREGFKGHPKCQFCATAFYSDDDLFQHCRKKHESCFICDRENPGRPRYYKNYKELEEHFSAQHFLCGVSECRDQKFVVFSTKFELQDHMLSEHPALVGTTRAARKVNLEFPPVTESHLHRHQSGGSSLRSQQASAASRVNPQSIQFDDAQFPALGLDAPSASSSSTSINVQTHSNVVRISNTDDELAPENTRAIQARRLDERARNYLNYDGMKFVAFKNLLESFRTGETDAKKLLADFHHLFDENVDDEQFQVLVESTANLSSAQKKQALLDNFNNSVRKSRNLQPESPAQGPKGKSWVPSRGLAGTQAANSNSASHFPALPSVASKNSAISSSSDYSLLKGNASGSRASELGRSRVVGTQTPSKPKLSLNESFPELPKNTPKKVIPRVKPITPVQSVWGSGQPSAPAQENTDSMSSIIGNAQAIKKGKKIIYRI